jgi:hypothetical protein
MKIDAADTGLLLFHDFVDVACATRNAKLKLDAEKFFLKAVFKLLPQLGAGWNGNYDFTFPLRALNGFVPFRLPTGPVGLGQPG